MSESLESLLELFEKGDFVELGLRIKKEFSIIDKNKSIKKKDKAKVKYDNIVKSFYDLWKPQEKAEMFFKLDDWGLNRLSFIVAVHSVAEGLATSQIRKVLNMSNRIYRKSREGKSILSDITKLSYILAYSAGRHSEVQPIAKILSKALPKADNKNYEKIHSFLQAVVAYHKLLGGD